MAIGPNSNTLISYRKSVLAASSASKHTVLLRARALAHARMRPRMRACVRAETYARTSSHASTPESTKHAHIHSGTRMLVVHARACTLRPAFTQRVSASARTHASECSLDDAHAHGLRRTRTRARPLDAHIGSLAPTDRVARVRVNLRRSLRPWPCPPALPFNLPRPSTAFCKPNCSLYPYTFFFVSTRRSARSNCRGASASQLPHNARFDLPASSSAAPALC
eukprot:6176638-Pleurochrysis_carterae.AAC.4